TAADRSKGASRSGTGNASTKKPVEKKSKKKASTSKKKASTPKKKAPRKPTKATVAKLRKQLEAEREAARKTLAEVAAMRGTSPEETAMDLVIEDQSRVGTIYFLMSEENVRKQIGLPYMSFGSDAGAPAPEGVFLLSSTHPRAYGNFARLLGRYVRDEKIIPLEEAIRKLTSLPAENLGLKERGMLRPGWFADVVVFDPETIEDHATFEDPHQYATGVRNVFVNGTEVLRDGEHTGATPGRVIRGAGYR
ncbi:MAG: amidohydrolase family protein, partial [Acidobacteria bacterium]|nr:amidohydrolase family protein [Acidobacteriota bacterium]